MLLDMCPGSVRYTIVFHCDWLTFACTTAMVTKEGPPSETTFSSWMNVHIYPLRLHLLSLHIPNSRDAKTLLTCWYIIMLNLFALLPWSALAMLSSTMQELIPTIHDLERMYFVKCLCAAGPFLQRTRRRPALCQIVLAYCSILAEYFRSICDNTVLLPEGLSHFGRIHWTCVR